MESKVDEQVTSNSGIYNEMLYFKAIYLSYILYYNLSSCQIYMS